MNKATNKLASGIRKVKERRAAPVPAETTAVRPPVQRRPERGFKSGDRGGDAFAHPPRVWPD
jgi:hypothetical protein